LSVTCGRCFSSGTLVSSTNKTDRHDISEILLKVALSKITITQLKWKIKYTTSSEQFQNPITKIEIKKCKKKNVFLFHAYTTEFFPEKDCRHCTDNYVNSTSTISKRKSENTYNWLELLYPISKLYIYNWSFLHLLYSTTRYDM